MGRGVLWQEIKHVRGDGHLIELGVEGMEAGWSTGAMDIGDEDVDGPRVEGQRGGRG